MSYSEATYSDAVYSEALSQETPSQGINPGDPAAFLAMVRRTTASHCYLAEITAGRIAEITQADSDDPPVYGGAVYGSAIYSGPGHENAGQEVTSFFSDRGFMAAATDAKPNQYYDGRLIFSAERTIYTDSVLSGLAQLSGQIEVLNDDGAYDLPLDSYSFDGRRIDVLLGSVDAPLSEFGRVFRGETRSVSQTISRATHILSDAIDGLDAPIQTELYQGTGGLEGPAELQGQVKPICIGLAENVPGILIDPVTLDYQVHHGGINDVISVFDSGIALDKVSGPPDLGEFSVNKSNGTFRLGGAPAGAITADVLGSSSPQYIERVADIISRILQTYCGVSNKDINADAFALARAQAPGQAGIWIGQPTSCAEVIAELARSIGAIVFVNRFGLVDIKRIRNIGGDPVLELDETNIKDIDTLPLPPDLAPTLWKVNVGFRRNYTVQTDLAASATSARRIFAASQYRYATIEDAAIKVVHKSARELTINSAYKSHADALAEARRLFNLFGAGPFDLQRQRRALRIRASIEAVLAEIGDPVSVRFPRYQLHSGRAGIVLGYRYDSLPSDIELTVLV